MIFNKKLDIMNKKFKECKKIDKIQKIKKKKNYIKSK